MSKVNILFCYFSDFQNNDYSSSFEPQIWGVLFFLFEEILSKTIAWISAAKDIPLISFHQTWA